METDIPEDGFLDGAMLFDVRDSENRASIKKVFHRGQHSAVVRERSEHYVVEYLHKSSGAPQWSIDFWVDERQTSITGSIEDAKRLAQQFLEESEPSAGGNAASPRASA